MARNQTLLMGAVAYDPKVVTIWDGFKRYLADHLLDFDYVLYSHYERQVEAHLQGHVDVAWNSPLAWLQTDRVASMLGRTASAICMRDTDRDLTSVIVVKADSPLQRVEDVRGKRVGVGAHDSPQVTLIPLHHLETVGLRPREDFEVVPFDVLVGKHGDHIGGERDAVDALKTGDVDATCLFDSNLLVFAREGTLPSATVRVLARTPAYDHCNFTVLDDAPADLVERFRALLLGMSYDDPAVRTLLDLEGLKVWKPGRTEGYSALTGAIDSFGTINTFAEALSARCRRE